MVTPTTFRTRFPEFSNITNYPDARVQLFIDDALLQTSEQKLGTSYDVAVSYLSAHYLALSDKSANGANGSIGAVASKSVEGVSVSYSNATSNNQTDGYLSSTIYGQRYMEIKSQISVANVMSI